MISFLLTWRALALLALGVVTALLGWSALTLRIDPGMESMIPSGPGDLARLQAFQARFGSDEIVVLAFHSDRLFSRESLDRLDQLTRRVAELPHVARVLSPTPTNVRDLDGDELGPVPLVPYAQVAAGKLSPEALGARLGSHPLFGGLLVAKDARTASVLGELGGARQIRGTTSWPISDAWRARLASGLRHSLPGSRSRRRTWPQTIFVPLVFLILAAMTVALYRHPVGMLVPLATVTLALVWTSNRSRS